MTRQIDDHHYLTGLSRVLDQIAAELDSEENVPQRYDGSVYDVLAGVDSDALRRAGGVLARLGRWAKWPILSERDPTHSYIAPAPPSLEEMTPILRILADIQKER